MSGTVRSIRIHPVKGEPAVELDSITVGPEGLDGDRRKGAAVHLVSLQALARSDEPPPRANLVLDLPDGDERSWIGAEVTLGSVTLSVVRAPRHCLGVYADVVTPGRLNLGDAVEARG
jgi:uncharacterized protein YcbX